MEKLRLAWRYAVAMLAPAPPLHTLVRATDGGGGDVTALAMLMLSGQPVDMPEGGRYLVEYKIKGSGPFLYVCDDRPAFPPVQTDVRDPSLVIVSAEVSAAPQDPEEEEEEPEDVTERVVMLAGPFGNFHGLLPALPSKGGELLAPEGVDPSWISEKLKKPCVVDILLANGNTVLLRFLTRQRPRLGVPDVLMRSANRRGSGEGL